MRLSSISPLTLPLAALPLFLHPENPHLSPHGPRPEAAEAKTRFALSRTEYSRLARAFYHLELYGGLFYTSDSRQDDITAAEQSGFFLQRLRDWEQEEFLCVRNYLTERLTNYLNRVEDDFMRRHLEDEPHMIETAGPAKRWNQEDWFFSDDDHGQLQEEWLEGCLTRGLRTLRVMLTADTSEDRFDALGSTDLPRNTLSQVLSTMPVFQDRPRREWAIMNYNNLELYNDLEKYNEAWLWATKRKGHPRCSTNDANDQFVEGSRRWDWQILMGYFLLTASNTKSLIATYQYLAPHLPHFFLYKSSLLSRGSFTGYPEHGI